MAPIVFYNMLMSQPCRAVYLFMKANRIPFTSKTVDLMTGDNLKPEFTRVSPLQKVPVIDDNGFVFSESAAIFKYLKVKYKLPEHWYPTEDLCQQARVEEYLHWHHTNTRYMAMMLFRHQFVNTMRGKPVKQDEVAQFKQKLREVLRHIETYFLQDNKFLCGDEISVADIQAVCELMQLQAVGDDKMFTSSPRLNAWVERVRSELQPYFDECNEQSIGQMKMGYDIRLGAKI